MKPEFDSLETRDVPAVLPGTNIPISDSALAPAIAARLGNQPGTFVTPPIGGRYYWGTVAPMRPTNSGRNFYFEYGGVVPDIEADWIRQQNEKAIRDAEVKAQNEEIWRQVKDRPRLVDLYNAGVAQVNSMRASLTAQVAASNARIRAILGR